ncbi:MAG: isoprenylcysteine carboxylmethyltransferase family protein [Pseudomonadota bacterium]
MNLWVGVIVGLVAVQRLVELVYAERNTRALKARGAVEIGRGHYPLIVALHASWLITVAVAAPADTTIAWGWLTVFVVLQGLRIWVVGTLGPYWTTRIITLPGAPLVRKGPYRFVRHPNYLVVAGEIAVLPLVFGEWRVAIVFTLLNAAVLAWRIHQEDKALDVRRGVSA